MYGKSQSIQDVFAERKTEVVTIIGSRRWYGDFISGSIEAQVLGSCGWDVDGGGCGAGLRVDSVEEAGALWRRIEFHVPPIQIQ